MQKSDHPYRPSWPACELFVSPRGSEKYSGTCAASNAFGSDGPVPSIGWALDRLAASPPTGPATIWLDEGTHYLDEPLVLGPELPAVTFAALPGKTVVLSGGRRIGGWTEQIESGRRVWRTTLREVAKSSWYFRSLFVNGAPRQRPRLPKTGTYRIASVPGMTFEGFIGPPESHHETFFCAPGEVQNWRNLADIDAVAVHYWMEERLPLARVNPATGEVVACVKPWFPLKDDASSQCARFWFENVAEALEEPGQWYLDRPTGELTYLPRADEQIATTEIIAPVLDHLVRIEGRPERPVQGIVLKGLTLAHADWSHIPGRGTDAQAASSVPALVQLSHARQCAIEDCQIGPAGPYGIEVGPGCRGNRITGNRLIHLGAGGIKVTGCGSYDPAGRCSHTLIEKNEITDCGTIFLSAVGILIVHSDHNIVRANHIHHIEYSGISCGWTWGFGDSPTHHNVLENNHLHHLGSGLLNDMGGIYTLGEQPGTVIRHNHIHHIIACNYGGWAIYADEGSSYLTIENNLLHHTSSECVNLHYGRENILRNNVMLYSGLGVVSISAAGADYNSLNLERNILIGDGKPVLVARDGDSLTQRGFRSDLNLLWDLHGPVFGGDESRDEFSHVVWKRYDLVQLQALGYDLHSRTADPCFADLAKGNFVLSPDSPAHALGFTSFVAVGTVVGHPKKP